MRSLSSVSLSRSLVLLFVRLPSLCLSLPLSHTPAHTHTHSLSPFSSCLVLCICTTISCASPLTTVARIHLINHLLFPQAHQNSLTFTSRPLGQPHTHTYTLIHTHSLCIRSSRVISPFSLSFSLFSLLHLLLFVGTHGFINQGAQSYYPFFFPRLYNCCKRTHSISACLHHQQPTVTALATL